MTVYILLTGIRVCTGCIGQEVVDTPVRIVVRIALGVSLGFFQFGVEEFRIVLGDRQFDSGSIVDKIICLFRIYFAARKESE